MKYHADNYKHAAVTVLAAERFELLPTSRVISALANSLTNVGFAHDRIIPSWGSSQRTTIDVFTVVDREKLNCSIRFQSAWLRTARARQLITDYYDTVIVACSGQDILFGLASARNPLTESPVPVTPATGPQDCDLGLLLCKEVLLQSGKEGLGNKLTPFSPFSPDYSLQASIVLTTEQLRYPGPQSGAVRKVCTSVDILSTHMLLWHEELRNISARNFTSLLIAKAAILDFMWHNFYEVNARQGRLFEVAEELLVLAVHSRWNRPVKGVAPTSEQLVALAEAQLQRINTLKETERRIAQSLDDVRHIIDPDLAEDMPKRKKLLPRWKVNNQYACIAKYSHSYADLQEGLEAVLHPLRTPPPSQVFENDCGYVFRLSKGEWEIRFGPEAGTFLDEGNIKIGMRRIRLLLSHAGKELDAICLAKKPPQARPKSVAMPSQQTIDKETHRRYKERLEDIEDDSREAKEKGNVGRQIELEKERARIGAELRKAYRDKDKADSDPVLDALDSVRKSIDRALEVIEKKMPVFAKHFRDFREGALYKNDPQSGKKWVTR